jgi:hypothetical protein
MVNHWRRWRRFANRSGIGFFAPLVAGGRMIRKRRMDFLRQMRVVYRYAFWKG